MRALSVVVALSRVTRACSSCASREKLLKIGSESVAPMLSGFLLNLNGNWLFPARIASRSGLRTADRLPQRRLDRPTRVRSESMPRHEARVCGDLVVALSDEKVRVRVRSNELPPQPVPMRQRRQVAGRRRPHLHLRGESPRLVCGDVRIHAASQLEHRVEREVRLRDRELRRQLASTCRRERPCTGTGGACRSPPGCAP